LVTGMLKQKCEKILAKSRVIWVEGG
jgi:hypothetical protein